MNARHNAVQFRDSLRPAAEGGRIGVVALATDLTIERELRKMLPPDVEMFTNRVLNKNPLTPENLRAMRGDIARAAAGLLPGRGVNVAVYACTSGAAVIGAEAVHRELQKAHPNAPATTPLEAAFAAFAALNAKRISVLTPYLPALNIALEKQFAAAGVEMLNADGLGFENDLEIADIAPESILRFAKNALHEKAEALFISCTALRAAEVIEEIERAAGVPVVASNQALAWHSLRLLKHPAKVKGFGILMRTIK